MAKRVKHSLTHLTILSRLGTRVSPKRLSPLNLPGSLCTGQHPVTASMNPHFTSNLAKASDPPAPLHGRCMPPRALWPTRSRPRVSVEL